jgi:Flp pilus assembly protein CpaB
VKKKTNTLLILAVALGLAACYTLWLAFDKQKKESEERMAKLQADMQSQIDEAKKAPAPAVKDEKQIVVATQPIAANQKVEIVSVKLETVPANLFPRAYSTLEEAVGKYASRGISIGEPVSPDNASTQAQRMSMRLTPGMRAMAIPVFSTGDTNTTGFFALDGDYVDLLYTYTDQTLRTSRTITVMQNVKILYNPTGMRNDQTDGILPAPTPGSAPVVTFEVTPAQAETLVQLTGLGGSFRMILRNIRDREVVRTKGYSASEFFDNPRSVQKVYDRSQAQVEQLIQKLREAEEKEMADKAAAQKEKAKEVKTEATNANATKN